MSMTRIFTERLVIRSLTRCDINDVFDIMSDVETARAGGFAPMESLNAAERLIKYSNGYHFYEYGICERGSDKVIGLIQVVEPWGYEGYEAEIGYLLSKDYRCKGYMTEAVEAICGELFNGYTYSLILHILPTNDASLGVAHNVGFTYVEEDEDHKELRCTDLRPFDRYELNRDMWEQMHPLKEAA